MKRQKPRIKNTITAADVYGLFGLALKPKVTPFKYIEVELENKKGKGRVELFDYEYSDLLNPSPLQYPNSELYGDVYVNRESFGPLRPRQISFWVLPSMAKKLFCHDGYIERLRGEGYSIFSAKMTSNDSYSSPTYFAEIQFASNWVDGEGMCININTNDKRSITNIGELVSYCRGHGLRLLHPERFDHWV